MTKLILTLPNENSTEENLENLHLILEETGIIDYPHIVAIHKGEKDGFLNKHAHINFFERKFEKGNSIKNRLFNAKDFVTQVLVKYQKVFGLAANSEARERIARIDFQENKQEYKQVLEEIAVLDKAILQERRSAVVAILGAEELLEQSSLSVELKEPVSAIQTLGVLDKLIPGEPKTLEEFLQKSLPSEAEELIAPELPQKLSNDLDAVSAETGLIKIEVEVQVNPEIELQAVSDELIPAEVELMDILSEVAIPVEVENGVNQDKITEYARRFAIAKILDAEDKTEVARPLVADLETAPGQVKIFETEIEPGRITQTTAVEAVEKINDTLAVKENIENEPLQEIPLENHGISGRPPFSNAEDATSVAEIDFKQHGGHLEPVYDQSSPEGIISHRIDATDISGDDEGPGTVAEIDFKSNRGDFNQEETQSVTRGIIEPRIDPNELAEDVSDDGPISAVAGIDFNSIEPTLSAERDKPLYGSDQDDVGDDQSNDEPKKRKRGFRL